MRLSIGGSLAVLGVVAVLAGTPAAARVEKITVHGQSLEGNLEGNSADRIVFVLLPPSYDTAKARRYPVVYFLHGYQTKAEQIMGWGPMEQRYEAAMAATKREFIVVVPDSFTKQSGSMYSDSVTVGNFETFTARNSSPMSTAITARSRSARAAGSRAIRWADMARCDWG